jgi:hypothetical protein
LWQFAAVYKAGTMPLRVDRWETTRAETTGLRSRPWTTILLIKEEPALYLSIGG